MARARQRRSGLRRVLSSAESRAGFGDDVIRRPASGQRTDLRVLADTASSSLRRPAGSIGFRTTGRIGERAVRPQLGLSTSTRVYTSLTDAPYEPERLSMRLQSSPGGLLRRRPALDQLPVRSALARLGAAPDENDPEVLQVERPETARTAALFADRVPRVLRAIGATRSPNGPVRRSR